MSNHRQEEPALLAVLQGFERLKALEATRLLDTPPEAKYDRLTELAAALLEAPIALMSLVDGDRQFFKSGVGLPEPIASLRQTPLSHSFCKYTVASGQDFIVEDATLHPLVKDSPMVRELGVRAYAGVSLFSADGHAIGAFCALDLQPRKWSVRELAALREIARAAIGEMWPRPVPTEETPEQRYNFLVSRLRVD